MKSNKIYDGSLKDGTDSDTVPFSLTLCRYKEPITLPNERFVDAEGSSYVFTVNQYPEHTNEVVCCYGLLHFKNMLENMGAYVAFRPGLPDPGAKRDSSIDPSNDSLERIACDMLVHKNESYSYPENGSALICFEVDSKYGAVEEVWNQLCEIDPTLKEVGYLYAPYGALVDDEGSGTLKHRFYCIAAGEIPKYVKAFIIKANIVFPFYFESHGNERISVCQLLDPPSLAADHFIYEQKSFTAHENNLRDANFRLLSGKVLDTREYGDITSFDWYALQGVITQAFEAIGYRHGDVSN